MSRKYKLAYYEERELSRIESKKRQDTLALLDTLDLLKHAAMVAERHKGDLMSEWFPELRSDMEALIVLSPEKIKGNLEEWIAHFDAVEKANADIKPKLKKSLDDLISGDLVFTKKVSGLSFRDLDDVQNFTLSLFVEPSKSIADQKKYLDHHLKNNDGSSYEEECHRKTIEHLDKAFDNVKEGTLESQGWSVASLKSTVDKLLLICDNIIKLAAESRDYLKADLNKLEEILKDKSLDNSGRINSAIPFQDRCWTLGIVCSAYRASARIVIGEVQSTIHFVTAHAAKK
jgi:hypothetical protein